MLVVPPEDDLSLRLADGFFHYDCFLDNFFDLLFDDDRFFHHFGGTSREPGASGAQTEKT